MSLGEKAKEWLYLDRQTERRWMNRLPPFAVYSQSVLKPDNARLIHCRNLLLVGCLFWQRHAPKRWEHKGAARDPSFASRKMPGLELGREAREETISEEKKKRINSAQGFGYFGCRRQTFYSPAQRAGTRGASSLVHLHVVESLNLTTMRWRR
jgi:hypothetical protein